ncbi:MAG: VOC family protein [Acidiferrobacterales bacterium]|nr:VOC family protein [Acidiferrobacterales bacterium]
MTLSLSPLAIDHIVLRTQNLVPMKQFYCEVLGCVLERETDAKIGLTQLRAGSALIDLVTVDSELGRMGGKAPGPSGNNMDHFCLRIAPINQIDLIEVLRSHGVQNEDFKVRNGAEGFGPSIYIYDPDGNQVELRCSMVEGAS